VRIDRGAEDPLKEGDVVLEAQGVKLAGLSVEQANQLAIVPTGAPETVIVMRSSSPHPLTLQVSAPKIEGGHEITETPSLDSKRVAYGDGFVAEIAISDVPDDLGDRLGAAIREAKQPAQLGASKRRPRASQPDPRQLLGVVLDLRGNGGGSTDGAIAALGLFIPGAPMFPMKRRDGGIEVDRAPVPVPDEAWKGPLAVLVDGESASAAEMIAGAIATYHRGVLVGSHTYGKGCAQEYLDDDVQRGVLRLTTLVFSLPDGSPLQRVGLDPQIALGLGPSPEREAFLPHSLDPWRGPDVRDHALVRDIPWPSHGGHVGPCSDETLCRALRALGSSPAAAR
jgi:carboxyl-terminal processing protease